MTKPYATFGSAQCNIDLFAADVTEIIDGKGNVELRAERFVHDGWVGVHLFHPADLSGEFLRPASITT